MRNPIPAEAEYYLDEYDAERFWSHVDRHGGEGHLADPLATAAGECWLWNGKVTTEYGRFELLGKWQQAHRVAYRDCGFSLDADANLDHLCRTHSCVNPAHVEPVTQRVNIQRGILGNKTHCPHGHELTDENTRISRGAYGPVRRCKTCLKASTHEAYIRRRNAA